MGTDRTCKTEVCVLSVVSAAGTTGAGPHGQYVTEFAGSFTLPFEAHWGGGTLPAGEYTLNYGIQVGGLHFVEFLGKAKGSPHGIVLIQEREPSFVSSNVLICIRGEDNYIIRSLEMPAIGESVSFALPEVQKLRAQSESSSTSAKLSERLAPTQHMAVNPSEW